MRFDWSAEHAAFREDLRAFVEDVVPDARSEDVRRINSEESRSFMRWFVRELAARGWLAPHWPTEYGGQNDTWRHIILNEELWSRGEPRGPQYMNVNWIAPIIMAVGTEAQRRYHLERIRAGDVVWCQGLSEPEAGSDLASLRTQAELSGDAYVVRGQKIWTSYAHIADFCFLLARTDPDAARHDGLSILLVPMETPGIEVRDIDSLAGEHAFHEVFFTDVRIPASCRLGQEGEGWNLVRRALAYERVGSPRYAKAAVELDRLAEWARQHGVLEDGRVLEHLGRARASCEAARLLAYQAIDERAKGLPPGGNAYVARAAMVAAERAVAKAAADVMGPEALREDSIADRQLTSAQVAGLAAGTYEVQLNLVSRLSLQLPKG